jgi:hypothetical protein
MMEAARSESLIGLLSEELLDMGAQVMAYA